MLTAFLNIIIEDENDNNPKFKQPFYRKTITENSINGVLIANILAYDSDKNKTITYSLEGNPTLRNFVHIDPQTGEMVVANKIDHEQYQWLNLSVRASDSGIPQRTALVDVYVSVLDENDNNPYFIGGSKNYTISENVEIGARIGTVQASDADSGDFGKITFLMDRISSQVRELEMKLSIGFFASRYHFETQSVTETFTNRSSSHQLNSLTSMYLSALLVKSFILEF